jgi:predicted ferric reductase
MEIATLYCHIDGKCVHVCVADNLLQMMELELKKLEETIKNIHEEMFYLRER